MKLTRIASLLLAMVMTISFASAGAAQSDYEEYHDILNSATTSYSQQYFAIGQFEEPSDSVAWTLPVLTIGLYQFDDEATAAEMMSYFESQTDGESIVGIDDLGDNAFKISGETPNIYQESIVAQSGATVFFSYSTPLNPNPGLGEELLRFMIEQGAGEGPVVVNADGTVTGGWAEAFPVVSDFPELASYEAPVWGINAYPPASEATPQATPES